MYKTCWKKSFFLVACASKSMCLGLICIKLSNRAVGSFSIQKFILQIFAIINVTSVMNSGKKIALRFSKNEGGGQWPFGTFPKIHPF